MMERGCVGGPRRVKTQVKSRLELHLNCLDLTWTATKPDQEVCRTAQKARVVASDVLTFTDRGTTSAKNSCVAVFRVVVAGRYLVCRFN